MQQQQDLSFLAPGERREITVILYTGNFLVTKTRFLRWLREYFLPAVDVIGLAGLRTMSTFRSHIDLFNLPPEWLELEAWAARDNGRGSYHVLFNGASVGVTLDRDEFEGAILHPGAQHVSCSSLQRAHVCYWRFLLTLAHVHLGDTALDARAVFFAALPHAPTRSTRDAMPVIFQELP
ncbi:unnamed protein product [Peniophora sp. CBMAI 1063]|nr:unnamed protein product [Peniophora sp. CBMAI 1063]